MRLLAVTGFKGGSGKTTTALHLARYLSDLCGLTVLCDSDPNRAALKREGRGSGLPFKVCDEGSAPRLIRYADWVVIDTPARPSSDDLLAITERAELTIIPVPCDPDSVDAAIQTLSAIAPGSEVRWLLTICPPRPSDAAARYRAMLEDLGLSLFRAQIRQSASFRKASEQGCTVAELKGRDRLPWLDYSALAKEILNG